LKKSVKKRIELFSNKKVFMNKKLVINIALV
jgi:hypothetical protein